MLRLKGGDPCVFGRGGEEALALARAAIPFRIVPGITAGIGRPAYAGIPVTHRDTNSAVTFLTGHDSNGDLPGGLDWDAIAQLSERWANPYEMSLAQDFVRRLSSLPEGESGRLLFQLELVGLSRLGTNPIQVLKDNIPGYKLLREERKAPYEPTIDD